MAGRAATAVKPKPKVRSAAKPSLRVKAAKKPTVEVSASGESATVDVPAPKTRRRAKVETRTRIYWAVFNQDVKRVAVFEFDQKVEAEKRAAKLTSSSGIDHFIQKIKATVAV